MKHALTLASAVALSLCCASASAQLAYTSKVVNMRAGPALEYPLVAVLPAGLQVDVRGCLGDYRWCDVVAGVNRGWVYAGNINYAYQNRYEPLLAWGPVVGLAILGFTFDDYWQQNYRNRPWYGERSRWQHVAPPPPRQWREPAHRPPPSGWAPPRSQPPGPGWAPPGQQPSYRPPPQRGQQPPPSGWAPPQGQAPRAAPAPRPQQPAARPGVPPGQAHQRPPPQQPAAVPVPVPRQQPGAAPQPRQQQVPRAARQPQPAKRPLPDNSGRGQPQNP